MIGAVDGNRVGNYLFADFLHLSRNENASRIYLTEFDAFERVTRLQADTNWRNLLIKEPLAEAAGVNEVF